MDRLEAMTLLIASVESGSFTAASRQLNVPLPTVSRKMSALEDYLGVRLLIRSTRNLTLTDAGAAYVQSCKQILEQVDEAERSAVGEFRSPRGDLLITAPVVFGKLHFLPIINEFLATYPEINVRLILSDQPVNLADEHIDVALRVGKLPDSSMVATQVGTVERVICASPDYLASHGKPKEPADLTEHACVSYEAMTSGPVWVFRPTDPQGESVSVNLSPRLSVNTAESAIEAAIAGVGLTHVLSYQVVHAIEKQQLRLVLRDYEPEPVPVHLMRAGQSPLPAKTRCFFEFAVPRMRTAMAADHHRLQTSMSIPLDEYPNI